MAELTHDLKSNVFINNVKIEDISFNCLKSNLFNISNDISKNDLQLSNFREIKSKLATLKVNLDNKDLTDQEFRSFIRTLF